MNWLVSHRYLVSAPIGGGTVIYAAYGVRWALVVVLLALWLRIVLGDPT